MKKLSFKKIISFLVISYLTFGVFMFAQAAPSQSVPNYTPRAGLDNVISKTPILKTRGDLIFLIGKYVSYALGLVGVALVLLIIWAGYERGTAGGNEKKIQKSNDIMKNAVIGLLIIFASYTVVVTLLRLAQVNI